VYVALTDLSKFGDAQFKYGGLENGAHTACREKLAEIIGKEKADEIHNQILQETIRAGKEGIDLHDAWEVIVNTKNKTAKAFILDAINPVIHDAY